MTGTSHDRTFEIEALAVIDFEASSLSQESWPIEVGLSWIESGEIRTWSSLIKPHESWMIEDWSAMSASVHRIPFEDLMGAPSAGSVAHKFASVLAARTLVSDAPRYENHWLARLLTAGDLPPSIPVLDYHDISFSLFGGYSLDMLYETLERRPVPHRAGPDSARLAAGWLKAQQVDNGDQRNP